MHRHDPLEPVYRVRLPLGGWLCLWDDGIVMAVDEVTVASWDVLLGLA